MTDYLARALAQSEEEKQEDSLPELPEELGVALTPKGPIPLPRRGVVPSGSEEPEDGGPSTGPVTLPRAGERKGDMLPETGGEDPAGPGSGFEGPSGQSAREDGASTEEAHPAARDAAEDVSEARREEVAPLLRSGGWVLPVRAASTQKTAPVQEGPTAPDTAEVPPQVRALLREERAAPVLSAVEAALRGMTSPARGTASAGREAPTEAPLSLLPRGEGEALPLLRGLRQAEATTSFVRGNRRALTVTLPPETSPPGVTVGDLDLACERDARRYGGSFALY